MPPSGYGDLSDTLYSSISCPPLDMGTILPYTVFIITVPNSGYGNHSALHCIHHYRAHLWILGPFCPTLYPYAPLPCPPLDIRTILAYTVPVCTITVPTSGYWDHSALHCIHHYRAHLWIWGPFYTVFIIDWIPF